MPTRCFDSATLLPFPPEPLHTNLAHKANCPTYKSTDSILAAVPVPAREELCNGCEVCPKACKCVVEPVGLSHRPPVIATALGIRLAVDEAMLQAGGQGAVQAGSTVEIGTGEQYS